MLTVATWLRNEENSRCVYCYGKLSNRTDENRYRIITCASIAPKDQYDMGRGIPTRPQGQTNGNGSLVWAIISYGYANI